MPSALNNLLPHRAPMQWIEALTQCLETTATATARFTADHFAVTDGVVPETALVECMAQTVAAALGERACRSGQGIRSGHGMLGAISNFQIHAPVPLDKPVLIEVRELKRFGPMLLVAGRISCEDQLIAEGELSLYA